MSIPRYDDLFGLKLTEEQWIMANSIKENLFTGVAARSGSGKTTVAVAMGKLLELKTHYIFPTVEEKALGFTTGGPRQKESKYLTPLNDALEAIGEIPSQAIIGEVTKWGKPDTGWVHAYSHNYMRGGNLIDCLVIIDEAQNLTKRELRKILTRIHDSCHVVLIGDPNQIDINPKDSGFLAYLDHYSTEDYALITTLTKNFRGRLSSHAETLSAV